MFQRPLLAIFTLVASIAITGCTIITGDGPVVEKTIELEPFHSVHVDGSFDVEITQAAVQNVVVATQENIMERFKMSVMDGVLHLSLEPATYMSYDLTVKLAMPTVSSIALDGSGDMKIGTFVGLQNLAVKLDGSGDIEVSGQANKVIASLNGSGDIDASELESIACEVELDGSGSVKVYASEKLKATLQGSGDIRYDGEPDVEAKIDGSGTIQAD